MVTEITDGEIEMARAAMKWLDENRTTSHSLDERPSC